MAITWRNVEGPSFKEAILAGTAAQQQMSSGFDNFSKILEQETKSNIANWDNTKQNNTDAFYADVTSKFRTPEEYQAAQRSGLIDQMRQQYGAQIDQVGARKFMEERPGFLMDRVLKTNDYTDKSREFTERPDRDRVASLIAAKDFTGARTQLDNLNLRDEASLFTLLNQGERTVVEQGQTDKKFASDMTTADVQRKTALGQLQVARQNAGTSALQARNSGLGIAANLAQNIVQQQGHIVSGVNTQVTALDDKLAKLEKDSVFKGGEYKDEHVPDLLKIGKDMDITTDAIGSFIKQAKEAYPDGIDIGNGQRVPITKGMMETAIAQGANSWGFGIDSWKGRDLFNELKLMVNAKDFGNNYASYTKQRNEILAKQALLKEAGSTQLKELRDAAAPYTDALTASLNKRISK